MEHAQKELLSVLLGHVFSLGLISRQTYETAETMIFSQTEFPALLQDPACLNKEA